MQYFVTVFISAFLLFQIQPIASKFLLPWFGGGAGVWTSCLLFFQFFLLAGYFYAFILSHFFKSKTQAIVHISLLAMSLASLPIEFSLVDLNSQSTLPTLEILKILILSIGFPFLLLSATSPLLHSWFAREKNSSNPYLLYAMSNVGSFLALLSYPVLIEPLLFLSKQSFIWSIGYLIFTICIGQISWQVLKSNALGGSSKNVKHQTESISIARKILWFLLSALGVVILVSTTNAMTQNIPPVPFLWIAPLALYLATYVVAFSHLKLYKRNVWLATFGLAAFLGLFIYFIGGQFDIITQVIIYLFVLLVGTMICHGELSYLKPQSQSPTLFYLILSLGGVFGSFLVTVVAQYSFTDFVEYPLALASVFVLSGLSLLVKRTDNFQVPTKNSTVTIGQRFFLPGFCLVAFVLLSLIFIYMNKLYQQYDLVKVRNFYGVLAVKDIVNKDINERRLIDGTTAHGAQSLAANKKHIPLSYYRPSTGIERVISELAYLPNLQVGIVGLGVGALAAYGNSGDQYTFYELNPKVADFAQKYFSFIQDSKAKVKVKLGDARVNLQFELDRGQLNQFDLLVIDAFSGDQIPSHLLTEQAFELYSKHLKNEGVLALHISNRHLSLLPVIMSSAKDLAMQEMLFVTPGGSEEHEAEWVILTNNPKILRSPVLAKHQSILTVEQRKVAKWTDDFSSLLPILKVLSE